MKVAVFDTHKFDRKALEEANQSQQGLAHELIFLEPRLTEQTVSLAQGCRAVCCFVNDQIDAKVLDALKHLGVELITLRSAGFNNVDIKHASHLGIRVVRVPEYSPYAVAEHAVALLLSLNRKIHKAYNRIHEFNFSLDGLVGFDLHGKTVGVIGTGRIGRAFGNIMTGFGCRVLVYDKFPDRDWAKSINAEYTEIDKILRESQVISLHIPLTPESKHIIDHEAISKMKQEAIIINTGRGALIDTQALIYALKKKRIAGACLDVYEEEEGIFFSDLSETGLDDDVLARLLTFPNVLMTSHQAFLTREALKNIADTTIESITAFEKNLDLTHVSV